MKKIIIFGFGFQAKVVLDCIESMNNYKVIGFMSDKKHSLGTLKKIKYLGSIENLKKITKKYDHNDLGGVVAVGSNFIRRQIVEKVNKLNKKFRWENIIHPTAIISKNVKTGCGNVILAGSIICIDTIIGNHVSINTGTRIDHDNVFSDFSSTGPAVATGGNVIIGELSFLGIGSSIKHNITIGKNTVIGGQSFVCNNCQSNSFYYGVPAKKIKKRSEQEEYL